MAAQTRLRVLHSISEIEASAWDALLGPSPLPFVRHAWLDAMESSGSASQRTGWEPQHLTLWQGETLVAAAPAYRKHHSMGEYVYDFSWAEAARSMGIDYYPKLLLGAPLSPMTAPRFLARAGPDHTALQEALLTCARELARETGCSGVHLLFPTEEDLAVAEAAELERRLTVQFHWKNPGYRTYDDYLSRFISKRRHQLKHERAAAAKQGILIATHRGAELTPARADLAYKFYEATSRKNAWGSLQLNRDFFRRVFTTLHDDVELVEATHEGKVVAGAFNVRGGDTLYGRYWGCFEEFPFLHFHVCLYHSIDDCIQRGIKTFQPGAGGEHKIARGFEPTGVASAHEIFNRRLDHAVRDFVRRERAVLEEELARGEEIAGLRPWEGPPEG